MTRDDLLKLAERVEREEPSRELAEAIARRLGWERDYTDNFWISGPGTGRGLHIELPFWLTSLDAAASLVKGWRVLEVRQRLDGWWVCVLQNQHRTKVETGMAPTEPRARTAAALRAIAMETPDEG